MRKELNGRKSNGGRDRRHGRWRTTDGNGKRLLTQIEHVSGGSDDLVINGYDKRLGGNQKMEFNLDRW